MIHQFDAWIVALLFFITMLAFWALGHRSGRRAPPDSGQDAGLKFTDASMAILGLLLAFTFAMALGRHDQRRLMVVGESNAIGDFYTCASLLQEPSRSALQTVIRTYTQAQIQAVARYMREPEEEKIQRATQELQGRMTELTAQALARGTPIAVSLTNTLNEVTSANASRMAAYEETLPWSIQLLLLLAAAVPCYLTGKSQGSLLKAQLSGVLSFIVLVTLVIYVTLDLNQGRRGLIQVNRSAFDRLEQSMHNDAGGRDVGVQTVR